MRVRQPFATEIRHRVDLAPDNIVQNPVSRVLQFGPNAENIMIAANHPNRAIGLQQSTRRRQPIAGEPVIAFKAGELVPSIIHRINAGIIGPVQVAA